MVRDGVGDPVQIGGNDGGRASVQRDPPAPLAIVAVNREGLALRPFVAAAELEVTRVEVSLGNWAERGIADHRHGGNSPGSRVARLNGVDSWRAQRKFAP